MSEDPTKRFDEQGKTTQPMLESLLEEVRAVRREQGEFRTSIENRIERLEIRVDRIESVTLDTRADVRELKLDLKEISIRLKEPV